MKHQHYLEDQPRTRICGDRITPHVFQPFLSAIWSPKTRSLGDNPFLRITIIFLTTFFYIHWDDLPSKELRLGCSKDRKSHYLRGFIHARWFSRQISETLPLKAVCLKGGVINFNHLSFDGVYEGDEPTVPQLYRV